MQYLICTALCGQDEERAGRDDLTPSRERGERELPRESYRIPGRPARAPAIRASVLALLHSRANERTSCMTGKHACPQWLSASLLDGIVVPHPPLAYCLPQSTAAALCCCCLANTQEPRPWRHGPLRRCTWLGRLLSAANELDAERAPPWPCSLQR